MGNFNGIDIPDWGFRENGEFYSFHENEDFPKDTIGFIYRINLSNGKSYIGRKKIWSITKKNFGKKQLANITDKRLKTYEMIKKQSDWLSYIGSNKNLHEDVMNGVRIIDREILMVCKTEKQMTYYENKALFCDDVLLSKDYYNDNIMGKFFRKDLING